MINDKARLKVSAPWKQTWLLAPSIELKDSQPDTQKSEGMC